MKARLIERGGSAEQWREIPLTQAEFLIGRGSDCELRLHGASISRHHCLIRLGAAEVTLTDLGSSNGTYLNGLRITSQAELHHGDEIKVGEFSFWIEVGDERLPHRPPSTNDSLAVTLKLPRRPKGEPEAKP
jgi:pSer/pThr/pTyr-binding forkhead associated (FHA) protein